MEMQSSLRSSEFIFRSIKGRSSLQISLCYQSVSSILHYFQRSWVWPTGRQLVMITFYLQGIREQHKMEKWGLVYDFFHCAVLISMSSFFEAYLRLNSPFLLN